MNVIEYAKQDAFKTQLLTAAKAGKHVYENTVNKIGNAPFARELRNKCAIKDIFVRYWHEFLECYSHMNIRDSIITNVNRMIACKDFSYGYIFYECPNCNHYHISGLSCHSRFCTSCGKIYREKRAN
nr:transposase zinc-binding domain-containing protein [Mycoplasmatota bacterium]